VQPVLCECRCRENVGLVEPLVSLGLLLVMSFWGDTVVTAGSSWSVPICKFVYVASTLSGSASELVL
jgi:hypothetical protein